MTEIKKVTLDNETEKLLTEMSECWESEGSCFGYRKNTVVDLENEDIFVCYSDGTALGYLLCHTYVQEKYTSVIDEGKRCLEIEELYVILSFRSKGIGSTLYNTAVGHYGGSIDYVTLGTATKDYKSILHFYIEELGMTFWSARLFKKI